MTGHHHRAACGRGRRRPERSPGNWSDPCCSWSAPSSCPAPAASSSCSPTWPVRLSGRRDVLLTRFVAHLGWFIVGFALFAVPALLSLWVARRLGPQVPIRRVGSVEMPDICPAGRHHPLRPRPRRRAVQRRLGRQLADPPPVLQRRGVRGTDAAFGRDIGFYVFDLRSGASSRAGWFGPGRDHRLTVGARGVGHALAVPFTAPVRAHLSLLGAALLLDHRGGLPARRAELVYSTRGIGGTVQAAMYTDMNAAGAGLRDPDHRRRGLGRAAAREHLVQGPCGSSAGWAGAWLVLSIVVGGFYPGVVQRFSVEPNELERERVYLERHLAPEPRSTHAIEERDFTGEQRPRGRCSRRTRRRSTTCGCGTTGPAGDVRPAADPAPVLQLPRRRHRPLPDRRRRAPDHAVRPRDRDRPAGRCRRTWTNERLVFTHGYGSPPSGRTRSPRRASRTT